MTLQHYSARLEKLLTFGQTRVSNIFRNKWQSCIQWQRELSTTRKLWSSGRALGSRSEGRGFDPSPMLDGSGVKAMQGLISTPNSGSLKKIQAAKWGTQTK